MTQRSQYLSTAVEDALGIVQGQPLAIHSLEDILASRLEFVGPDGKGVRNSTQAFDSRNFPKELYEGFNYLMNHEMVSKHTASSKAVQLAVTELGAEVLREHPAVQFSIETFVDVRQRYPQKSTRQFREKREYDWACPEFERGRGRRFSMHTTERTADILANIERNSPLERKRVGEFCVIAAFSKSNLILPQENGLKTWCENELLNLGDWLTRIVTVQLSEIDVFPVDHLRAPIRPTGS